MRIALAGLGHVGAATLCLLQQQSDLITRRSGEPIEIVAVSARDKNRRRDCDFTNIDWVEDPVLLAKRNDIDAVLEMIGGTEGIARTLAEHALAQGKHLITANKALIATHGVALARLAEKHKAQLSFEAAVCGGVPILKLLREGLAANALTSIRGILNGTCNYILTRMGEGVDFDSALGEAQAKGYAEKNPAADIDGIDSAYKLALLAAVGFNRAPDFDAVFIEGIRHLTPADLHDAAAKDGRIKLIGIAEKKTDGVIMRVQPAFIALTEPLARVDTAANGIEMTGDSCGRILLQGIGAGGKATASAIVADLIDIARGFRHYAFGMPLQTGSMKTGFC